LQKQETDMGQFLECKDLVTSGGAGEQTIKAYGILANIDIVPKESSSFDITISRVLPDGTEVVIFSDTGITDVTPVGRADMTPTSIELAGEVKVELANAGNHDNACHVYFTVV
jgi:hypothetical protein